MNRFGNLVKTFVTELRQAATGWGEGMAALEEDGATAIFGGRRYVQISDYRFQIAPKFRNS